MKKLFLKMASVLAALSIVLVLMPQTVNAASNGTADFVTRFYQLCLSRDPDPAGLKNWVDQLQSGKQTGANVAHGFVFSPEFIKRHVSNDEYINIMYKAFFNRKADAAGFKTWSNALESGLSRFYVLAGFTNSKEFSDLCGNYGIQAGSLTLTDPADVYPNTAAFVTRFYKQCLGRGADATGLNNWVASLQSGAKTGCDVAYGFVFSPEFQNRNVTDDEYINIMYHAFFNRDADAKGYDTWATYLAAGFTRHYVLAGFVNSQEFKNLCASYKINPGSLAILEEDSSISKLLSGSSFSVEDDGDLYVLWGAVNTSGKYITQLDVTYGIYDKQGNPLTLSGDSSNVFTVTYKASSSPIPPMEILVIKSSGYLGGGAQNCGRVDIPSILITYSDGSSQTVNYAQSMYSADSAGASFNAGSSFIEVE